MTLLDHTPEFLIEPENRDPYQLNGAIEARDIGYRLSDSIQFLNNVSFQLEPGQHLALVGFSGSGKSTLSLMISQVLKSSSGYVNIDGHELHDLSKLDVALNISSVAQHPFIFTGSVRENLLYACNTLYLKNLRDRLPNCIEIIEMLREMDSKKISSDGDCAQSSPKPS